MKTTTTDRLFGVQLLALAGALVGDSLGVPALVTVGVTGFFGTLALALVSMTVALLVGVSHVDDHPIADVSSRRVA